MISVCLGFVEMEIGTVLLRCILIEAYHAMRCLVWDLDFRCAYFDLSSRQNEARKGIGTDGK